jgi:thiopeptide-type bacteriocin biosynthesis protein
MSKTANQPPKTAFTPARFFAFRTPLLPIEELLHFGEDLAAPAATPATLKEALASDRAKLRGILQEKLKSPLLRDALFIASPSLEESLTFWETNPESERGSKVEKSLVRYFQRMSGRPTPYGIFAGCSVGSIGEETKIELAPRSEYQRHTRLDMHYLCALTDVLTADREFRRGFTYYVNTSLYLAAGRFRYIESRLEQQSRERSYHLVSVEPSDYLTRVLTEAQNGISFEACLTQLVSDEITREEGEDFIHSLIDSQILVPRLEPAVTSQEPLASVIENLRPHPSAAKMVEELSQAREQIQTLDQTGLGAPSSLYHAIAETLKQLPAEVELPRLLQVDMTKPSPTATLGKAVINEITKGIALFHKLSRSGDALRSFKDKFSQRYESREMPLVEVLDDECGIGIGTSEAAEASPLIAGLDFPGVPGDPTGDNRDGYLLHLLQGAVSTNAQEISLTEKDIEALSVKDPLPLSTSIAAMLNISATSQEALSKGDFQVWLHHAGGPSAANLLGRFCHADESLRAQVEEHLRQEEAAYPDEIVAEIIHLPPGRVGNVICRPRLRAFEIPYLGTSSAPVEEQIAVQDIMVSVQGGRVRLRSKKLNKYISPRMSNAHNFASADVGLYRFLCQLRNDQTAPGIAWSWGSLEMAPFLPRVKFGKLVLQTASWKIRKPALEGIAKAKGDQIFVEAQKLRQAHQLPRRVHLSQFDNTLPLDFDNVLSVETFASLVKELPEIKLTEIYPSYDSSVVSGPEGQFTHELIVPFLVSQNEPGTLQLPPTIEVSRSFSPGSSWLYAKMYTGTATADDVLCRVIRPISTLAKESGALRWFFIRYSDPDWHIRFRIEGDPALLWQSIVPKLYEELSPLLQSGQVWRMQLDTYERELERYGGPGMLPSEDFFYADSETVLGIVEKLSGDEGNDARWRLALRGMDLLLEDMGFDIKAKLTLMRNLRASFAREFNADARFERQLDAKFRAERASLMSLFDAAQEAEHPLAPGLSLLRERSLPMMKVVAQLKELEAQKTLTTTLTDLAASYLHMHANRMLRGAARNQELVMYDFLRRIYESQEARQRKKM